LTIEPGTPFGTAHRRGRRFDAEASVQAACYEQWLSTLAAAGWHPYEVSNAARDGAWSQHNSAYWRQRDYVGFGPGAVSTLYGADDALRFCRPADWDAFLAAPYGRETIERLSADDLMLERLAMGLRSEVGVPINWWAQWRRSDPQGVWRALLLDGSLRIDNRRVRLSPRAWLMADSVATSWAAALLRAEHPDVRLELALEARER